MKETINLNIGAWRSLSDGTGGTKLWLPADDLLTHGVVVGMTGSGKTGLVTVMVEEAIGAGIPVLAVDVKGDLPNLLLSFPSFDPSHFVPWTDSPPGASDETVEEHARAVADARREALRGWDVHEEDLARFCSSTSVRVLTPGASFGEPLHMLSSLERRSERWDHAPEAARDGLSAAISLVLRLLGRDPDPAKSREHVFLSILAERRMARGEDAPLEELVQDLLDPPIAKIGALPVDAFLRPSERRTFAAALNSLLASPTFASWRTGTSLDVAEWLTPKDGRTPAVIVSVAHLNDEERTLVMGVLFEEVLSWVRTLPGTNRLRALVVLDEAYGFMPPHPANPPTKRPLVSLMKQARGFGVGVLVATQNPMDLDYRALSNAGVWCIGRLQTDADRARVLEGLSGANGGDTGVKEIRNVVRHLSHRWFVIRNAHAGGKPILLLPRWTKCWMRGPMTRDEVKRSLRHA